MLGVAYLLLSPMVYSPGERLGAWALASVCCGIVGALSAWLYAPMFRSPNWWLIIVAGMFAPLTGAVAATPIAVVLTTDVLRTQDFNALGYAALVAPIMMLFCYYYYVLGPLTGLVLHFLSHRRGE